MYDLGDRRIKAHIGVGCDEVPTAQFSQGQISQESGPEPLGLPKRLRSYPEFPGPVAVDAHL